MNYTFKPLHSFVATLIIFGSLAGEAHAAIIINNLTLSSTSVSFQVTGTFPDALPSNYANSIYLVNPDIDASPGFVLVDFIFAQTVSFSGSRGLDYVRTGATIFGDYMFVDFDSGDFAPSESINGLIQATWASDVFNPAVVSELDFYWGSSGVSPADGTFLNTATIAVPEPSTVSLLGLSAVAGVLLRRRRIKTVTKIALPSSDRFMEQW